MIQKILIGFALATVVILFILWLVTGGVREVADQARKLTEFALWNGTTTGQFRLPWQPDLSLGPVYIPEEDMGEIREEPVPPEEELAASQKEYDALLKKIEGAKVFGEPSSYRGAVIIKESHADEMGERELIELEASMQNTAPIGITGWSLQSALTGVRAYVPRGTEVFILGDVNIQQDIFLNPGAGAIIVSRASPLGTSFRESRCTGYLAGMHTFVPPLSRSCPPPAESLPLTPDTLRAYGDACFDFVQQIPACTFPLETPSSITPACRLFLANNLSYNGCVKNYRARAGFLRETWRIYLNASGELWRNTHDIIRLLDSEGRTVDVVSY